MDINTNAEVKGVGLMPSPAVEQADRTQAPVKPVQASADLGKSALDDKALHPPPEQQKISKEELAANLKEIQEKLNLMGTRLGLDIEESADVVVAKITDKDSGEVIKQIPSEKVLEIRSKIDDLIGILFDKKV